MPERVRITVLVDNARCRDDLATEHGLALWIEADGERILFDTGAGAALLPNAERLNIPLARASAIALSHGHYDHTGALAAALALAPGARIYAHPESRLARHSLHPGAPPRPIGIPADAAEALARAGDRVAWTSSPVRLSDHVGLTGPIPRTRAFEDTGGPFFLDAAGARPDPIADDQALWIHTAGGPVVVLGCAHAGVINTMEAVAAQAGSRAVYGILGGMHLLRATRERLEATAAAIERSGVRRLAPCHCTGDEAVAFLRARLPGRVETCGAGAVFDFP